MNMKEIRAIAKAHGIKPLKRTKIALVKSIQTDEGNFDCFATASTGECNQVSCLWRDDCLPTGSKAA